MQYISRFASIWACIALSAFFVSNSYAAALYTTDMTQVDSTLSISGTSSTYTGIGDDFNTGFPSITITGMSFYGGIDPSLTHTQLNISFYDTNKNLLATISPGMSETSGTNQVHTLDPSDFNLNGTTGVTIPGGAGYVIFSPFSATTVVFNSDGSYTVIPPDPNPSAQLGGGVAPTMGTNNGAFAALVNTNGVLSQATEFSDPGIPANQSQYAMFSLTGTYTPEPASLALLFPASLLLLRRRRSTRHN